MLTREEVVWAYRLILGREPENEAVVAANCQLRDSATLRTAFLNCDEFARTNKVTWLRDRWVAAPVMNGRYLMWIDLGDRYVSFGCLLDDYEPIETRFVRRVLRAGDVFVDVGANLGWYTLLACSIVGRAGCVHAFEPREITARYLLKTIELNKLKKETTVHRCGLSDAEGAAFLAWTPGTDNPGGSFFTFDTASEDLEFQKIRLRSLDSFRLPRLDFLKVDVEGAEMRVFSGARETLERHRPIILSELSTEMLGRVSGASTDTYFRFFENLNYRCYIIDGERCGDEVRGFPDNWYKPLINLGLIPAERAPDGFAAGLASLVRAT